MDQFAWSKTEALYYMGLLLSAGGLIACLTFAMVGPLSKRFEERKLMLWGGFFVTVISRVFCIPWSSDPPVIAELGRKFFSNFVFSYFFQFLLKKTFYSFQQLDSLCQRNRNSWLSKHSGMVSLHSSLDHISTTGTLHFDLCRLPFGCDFDPNNFQQGFGSKASRCLDGSFRRCWVSLQSNGTGFRWTHLCSLWDLSHFWSH